MRPVSYDILTIAKDHKKLTRRDPCELSLYLIPAGPIGGRLQMPYRRVSYPEQCWYIVRFWLREKIRKDKPNASKTPKAVRIPRVPKSD